MNCRLLRFPYCHFSLFNLQFNTPPLYIVTKEAKSITSFATFFIFFTFCGQRTDFKDLRLLVPLCTIVGLAEHLAVMIKSHIRITEAIILHAEHDAVLLTQSFFPQQGQHF